MGHFDILLLQTPQDLFESALEAGAGDRFAGPGTLPGALDRPLHLPLVDALSKGLHHGLQLIEGGRPALPHMLQGLFGGLCRECQPGGDEEVCQEHLEACQGLQSGRQCQLRGQSREDSEGSGAVKYQNVP